VEWLLIESMVENVNPGVELIMLAVMTLRWQYGQNLFFFQHHNFLRWAVKLGKISAEAIATATKFQIWDWPQAKHREVYTSYKQITLFHFPVVLQHQTVANQMKLWWSWENKQKKLNFINLKSFFCCF
jgi:hypothetical protein